MEPLRPPTVPPNSKRGGRDDGHGPFQLLLGGLTAVSDWIGSNRRFFPPLGPLRDRDVHIASSGARTNRAVSELSWSDWDPAATQPTTFGELFDRFGPRPLQVTADDVRVRVPYAEQDERSHSLGRLRLRWIQNRSFTSS